jgi:hypothetical protein
MNHKEKIIKTLGSKYEVLSKDVPLWNSGVLVKCRIHNIKWIARADSLKKNHIGCLKCKSDKAKQNHICKINSIEYNNFRVLQSKRNTKSLKVHRSDIEKRHNDKIKLIKILKKHFGIFKCKLCKYEWKTRIDSVKSHSGCPKCAKLIMSVKKRKGTTKLSDVKYRKIWIDLANVTLKVYKKYKNLIDPNNLRNINYHIDHIYSLHDYYYNPKKLSNPIRKLEVCHPANLQMLSATDNIIKNKNSKMSASELRHNIRIWNKQYGRVFKIKNGTYHIV